ncbi:hypothetical protein L484_015299 [Morus notabilis]|uniref:Uncharacterized protein n=1 Tax=Morus notabilis TaxID=981085 RepID=W9RIA9_9ROSA|nr:hypothetical protein L484_015299 [Morus notabilis]
MQLERWEASIQDYEILLQETPENEEVKRSLLEAQACLRKRLGRDAEEAENGGATSFDSP